MCLLGLALCLQQFQSINLSDKDWIKTACSTMLEKLNFSFTELKEDVEEESNILDPGIELWKLWENVWNTQLDRGTHRFKQNSVRTTAEISKDSPLGEVDYDKPLTPPPSLKIRKAPGHGKTRHPLASGVSVDVLKPVQDQEQEKYYEDQDAGTFSWIPGGQLSIVVPYVDETRVVKVGEGFWLSQLTVTQDFYTQDYGK